MVESKAKPSHTSSRRILGFNEGHLDMLKDELDPSLLKVLERKFSP